MNNFSIFSFGQIINKIQMIKFEVLCNVFKKNGLIKMKSKLFTQQVGWLGGKGIKFYSWGPRIKLYK
jgi:hypothetical protein